MRRQRILHAVPLLAALVVSCTFGGLGDYEIEECDPRATSAVDDVCSRLEVSDPCHPYQCAADKRCVQVPRDADRDGDPDLACGGTDCDDTVNKVSGIATETCDGRDNNCDGLTDEGVLEVGARVEIDDFGDLLSDQKDDVSIGGTGVLTSEMIGASVVTPTSGGGTCIRAVRLPEGSLLERCTLLGSESTLSPRQPYAQRKGTQIGAVFVSKSSCLTGRLMYRVGPDNVNTGGPSDLDCAAAAPGTALPAFAPVPGSEDAVVAWYRVSVEDRVDRYGGCADATGGPLVFGIMRNAWNQPVLEGITELAFDATSVAAPAILPIANPGGVLLVSPVGTAASAWWIRADDLATVPEPVVIPATDGARALSAAVREEGGKAHLLVAAEIGCRPQSIRISLGTLDPSGALSFEQAFEVVPSQGNDLVIRPAAQWVAKRGEWQVTWTRVAGGATVMAQRFTEEGNKIGEPFEVAAGSVLGATGSDGNVSVFELGDKNNRFWRVPLGCDL